MNSSDFKKIIMIGAGGHAKVLAECLQLNGQSIYAVVSPEAGIDTAFFGDVVHFQSDMEVLSLRSNDIWLVNGIGSLPNNNSRMRVYNFYKKKGFNFVTLIHPSALISQSAILKEGTQVLANALINTCSSVGENSIVNTNSTIDHDCIIENDCHIAPGVTISGNVYIGKNTHLGTGSQVINSVTIGENCIIGSGSTITKNITRQSIVYPAKNFVRER